MSLAEIKRRAKELKIEPEYLPESMMKQLTWDDQWIGYDDEETFAKKKEFADSMCFGGTMVWSIDFQEQYVTFKFRFLLAPFHDSPPPKPLTQTLSKLSTINTDRQLSDLKTSAQGT